MGSPKINLSLYKLNQIATSHLHTHAENASILKAIGTYIQAVKANPRFISSNQRKNAMRYVLIRHIIIENTVIKKLKWDVAMRLLADL